MIPECPVCGGKERYYSFLSGKERFDECRRCGLLAHKAAREISATAPLENSSRCREADEPALMADFFALLERYLGSAPRRLGVVGAAQDAFLHEARRRGMQATELGPGHAGRTHDVVAVIHLLEHQAAPQAYLEGLRKHLAEGGVLALITRQLVKPGWQIEKTGLILEQRQRYSFSDTNLQTLLWKSGFADVFLSHHLGGADRIRGQGCFQDQAMAFGRMRELRALPRLSVVVPVFNEASTVRQVLEALDAKHIPGIELEIIVVESASTDGSREIVREYEGRPRFRIVLEERPRGKGFAVRTGLRRATGDIILIQDADLEYDFLDYEMLVGPILKGSAAFVLGTRHAGHWKIRKFAQSRVADAMNVAHWVLVFALNQLYRQSMTDPFTMFKVFRADCLSGLEFECNRFDFDVELVCKLLRKGYRPLEIPVNYQSRSFEEGKKVRMFRDPLTWVKAMLKYRHAPVVNLPRARSRPDAEPGRAAPEASRSGAP